MGGSPAPQPSDPKMVGEATTKTNKETAITNARLNRFDQYTPQGSSEYSEVGTYEDGTPRYEQRTKLSEGEQGIYDSGVQFRQTMGDTANAQLGRVSDTLATPVDLSNEAVEGRLFELGRKRLDPMFAQQNEALQQQMANQGISVNSEAYGRGMNTQGQKESDAYNQLLMSGRAQSAQEILAQRNQGLNETTAMATGSQVSQPNFAGFQGVAQANTDMAGIYGNYDKLNMAAWQQEQANEMGMMQGLFGLGGKLGQAAIMSDARLKRDILYTGGIGPKGLRQVEWTYIWGGPRHRGYIAQDVVPLFPDAVHVMAGGFLALDYSEIN